MGNIPNTTTNGLVLTSVGNGSNDSQWAVATSGGGSGITQLTSDVTAGPGSGSQIATLTGINGKAIPSSTASTGGEILYYNQTSNQWLYGGLQAGSAAPTVNQVLTWQSGSGWTAVTPSGGSGIANNDAGNLYLGGAIAQPASTQNFVVTSNASTLFAQNYAVRGAMTYTTTGASAGLVVGTNGVYHITGQIAITPSAALSDLRAEIVVGSAQIATSQAGSVAASQNEYLQVSCDWYITSGTLIQLAWYFVNASGAAARTLSTGGANTFISAHLVSS